MVAVDSELSDCKQNRTCDDVEKSELFHREHCFGVLVGNGSAYTLLNAISYLRAASESDLQKMMEGLEKHLRERNNSSYHNYLIEVQERVEKKHSLIADPEKRNATIAGEFAVEVDKVYNAASQQQQGCLYVVAYDRSKGKLKKYALPDRKGASLGELDLMHVHVDGSGGDLAGAYLSTQTSGLDWGSITPEYKFYLTSLACAAATANAGVGGFMSITTVDKDGARNIPAQNVNAAVRICGKQISGDISKKEAMTLVGEVLNDSANYFTIARKLGITKEDLLYAPCRLHQDVSRFNAMIFGA